MLRVEANAAMLIDNFLDEAHLPFVHAATIGGAGPEPIPRADVARHGLSFTAVREHTFTNLTDPAVRDGSRPAVQRRRMTYRYQAPLAATLLLEFLDAEGWQFLTFVVTPEDERACAVYQTVTGPGLADPEQADSAAKYEMTIFEEDLDLQRRALSGLEFPLDPAAELHTRADRVSVEFRRVLASAVSAATDLAPAAPPHPPAPAAHRTPGAGRQREVSGVRACARAVLPDGGLGRGERAGHGRQGLCDLGYAAFGELHSGRGEEHVHAAPVERVGCPLQEAPLFGAVDEAGDGRLVQAEVVRQLAHLDAPVAEDGEHTQLGQGEVVLGGDSVQHGHRGE